MTKADPGSHRPPRRAARLPRSLTGRLDRAGGRPEEWLLGSLQARVLQVLARRGPSTVRDVADEIQKRQPLAYTTVMTVLGALHQKGIVTRTKQGKGYLYEARYTEADLRDRIAQHLTRELVDDFGDVALAHFASALDSVWSGRRGERSRLPGAARRHPV